jgi:hypothetical protein
MCFFRHSFLRANIQQPAAVLFEDADVGEDVTLIRSIKFRARYRCGLKRIGALRFRFGGMLAHAPC